MLENRSYVLVLVLASVSTVLAGIIADYDSPKYKLSFSRTYNGTFDDVFDLVNEHPINYDMFKRKDKEYLCAIDTLRLSDLVNEDQSFVSLESEKQEAIKIVEKMHAKKRTFSGSSIRGDFGYWSYVVSYNSTISQMHAQTDSTGNINILSYQLSEIAPNAFDIASDFSLIASQDGSRYLTQNVYGGSICDLTGRPRSVTLKYVCSVDKAEPVIEDIVEPLTCNYVLTLAIPELCSSEIFRPKTATFVNDITCSALRPELTEYKTPINSIDILDYDLTPLGNGVFLGSLKENPKGFADIFITNRHDKSSMDPKKLLGELTRAWINSVPARKIPAPPVVKGKKVLQVEDRVKYVSYIYGFDGDELQKVMIKNSSEDDRLVVVSFTDQLIVENYLQLNETTMDINYLKAQDIIESIESLNIE